MNDDAFVEAFLECRLASSAFDHRGHLRIAWLLVQRHPLETAIEQICTGIERLAQHFGAPGKYHRTLSEALVRLIATAQARCQAQSFEAFVDANPIFATDVHGLLAQYYTSGSLCSRDAKQHFVPPDLAPLPQ